MSAQQPPQPPNPFNNFNVDMPAGGRMYLQSAEEVELWEKTMERYMDDYHLTNINDLHLMGAILQQQVLLFRSQRMLNGMEAELDASGVPTGRYTQKDLDAEATAAAQKIMNTATGQITTLEKVLGITKEQREAGGQISVPQYLRTLKRAAHERGIHIVNRVKKYEQFVQDLSWRLRVLQNADAEDRGYHDITPENVCDWARKQIEELAEVDRKFAKERGSLYAGKL
jgi:hypothetical protein